MPDINDMVHVRFSMRAGGGPFWQTNATVASVSHGQAVLDGFDRQIIAALSELKPAGSKRWILDWEIRTRP